VLSRPYVPNGCSCHPVPFRVSPQHTALRRLHPSNRRLALQRVTVNVAPAFVWHHPSTGAEVVGLYHAYGYGGIGDSIAINAVVVPGLDEVCD